MKALIWLRAETKTGERRTPLVPEHAKKLIRDGFEIVIERSPLRVFADEEYHEVVVESETKVPAAAAD